MPAQPWVTGPAAAAVTLKSKRPPSAAVQTSYYLGTCEKHPVIEIMPVYTPVFADVSGPRSPVDQIFDGEEALIRLDLTRWDEDTYRLVAAWAGKERGGCNKEGIGTLLILEGFAIELMIRFPYNALTAYNNMASGYRFPWCVLESPTRMDPLGTAPRKLGLLFHAYMGYNPQDGSQTLYDGDMANFPDPLAAPQPKEVG